MARLTEAQLLEFQHLIKEHCGREIGFDESLEQGTKLVRLIEIALSNENRKRDMEDTSRRSKPAICDIPL